MLRPRISGWTKSNPADGQSALKHHLLHISSLIFWQSERHGLNCTTMGFSCGIELSLQGPVPQITESIFFPFTEGSPRPGVAEARVVVVVVGVDLSLDVLGPLEVILGTIAASSFHLLARCQSAFAARHP